ncbi:hypothetical protein CC2G_013630 [Coprinopsis cinerea AmutBmut pab1-1]|nr:hypothetical protein CC2G_013630 [Coprinopsis cinerea AmutBmut pab1-1]
MKNPFLKSDPVFSPFVPANEKGIRQELQGKERQLPVLEGQARQLRLEINRLRSFLSPIQSLPVELLARIFAIACEGEVIKLWEEFSMAPPPTAILIAQVCKHWHAVVTTTPELWSQLDMYIGDCDNEGKLKELEPCIIHSKTRAGRRHSWFIRTAKAFLDRSQSLPLNLELFNYEEKLHSKNRIQELDLGFVDLGTFPCSLHFPILETLTLRHFRFPETATRFVAPRLSKLVYIDPDVQMVHRQIKFQLSWPSLSELTFFWDLNSKGVSKAFFTVLKQVEQLKTLCVKFNKWRFVDTGTQHSYIRLPHLQTLEIQDASEQFLCRGYLANFAAPALETFELFIADYPYEDQPEVLADIRDFLEFVPGLKSLRIGLCDANFLIPDDRIQPNSYKIFALLDKTVAAMKDADERVFGRTNSTDRQKMAFAAAVPERTVTVTEWPERRESGCLVENLFGWVARNTEPRRRRRRNMLRKEHLDKALDSERMDALEYIFQLLVDDEIPGRRSLLVQL